MKQKAIEDVRWDFILIFYFDKKIKIIFFVLISYLETDGGGRCEVGFDLSQQTQHLTEVAQIELTERETLLYLNSFKPSSPDKPRYYTYNSKHNI